LNERTFRHMDGRCVTLHVQSNAGYPDIMGDMKNGRKNGRPVERSWPCCQREITLALFQNSDKAV